MSLPLWNFQGAGSLAMAQKQWSSSDRAQQSSEESRQSCFCQVEMDSAHIPLDIRVKMRTSLYLPGQSLSCLFTQMKGEWVLPPLLENGNVFALICIVTDYLHPFRSPSPPPHCLTAWNMEGPGRNQEVGNTCLRYLEHPYSLLFPHSEHSFCLLWYPASSLPLTFCFALFSGKGLFTSGKNSSAEIYIPIFSLQWGFVS